MTQEQEEKLRQARYHGLVRRVDLYKRDLAKRLVATRRLFKQRVYAVDIHTHSNYSDGKCTVADNYAFAKNTGLDFLFATDHNSMGQKRMVRKWADASWGQEPGIGLHHVGLLCGSRLFRPRHDTVSADFERARKIAPFVWIPHPVGWYPDNWYSDEAIEILWTLGVEFAIEVINGACKVVRAYDAFDAKAVRVWDQLLCDGRKISALGGSDAHVPEDIGNVWTGVFAARRTAPSIIKALNAGHCFASEASLMTFSCSSQPMGSTVRKKKGAKLDLHFRIADSAGIASIRIVSQGRVVKDVHTKGRSVVESALTQKVGANPVYYRLESIAADDRRAFSTPIYVEPTR